jgi:hypothetical protein
MSQRPPIWLSSLNESDVQLIERAVIGSVGVTDISALAKKDEDEQGFVVQGNSITAFTQRIFQSANRMAFGFDIQTISDMHYLEHKKEMDWKADLEWYSQLYYDKKLNLIVQMSRPDDYEGGDFELEGVNLNFPQLRDRGTMIVFPSFMKYRITEVTKGVRKTYRSWMEGPRWR